MTAAVIYTLDLEPITVIDVPMWAWERLVRGEHINFSVPERLTLADMHTMPTNMVLRRVVRIFAEPLRRGDSKTLLLFTENDELALALQASFLPGQRGEVQRRERSARFLGFLEGYFLGP